MLANAPLKAEVPGASLEISDSNPLAMPEVGGYGLRILSPTLLELTLISTKGAFPARVSAWDFVTDNFVATIPSPAEFGVTVNGQPLAVQSVGFKRRPIYAPEKRDLRIGNHLYLALAGSVTEGQVVEVKNPSGTLWGSGVRYSATMNALRYSPAIHVNQAGYMPAYPKKSMIGFYLGSMGEMPIPAGGGFKLVDAKTGATVHTGTLAARADQGFSYAPTPYQKVYEADFTAFQTVGEYKLVVPGLGASFPFRIDPGVTANFARTFALGLYHQRCGGANELPYTRHTHEQCHVADAQVPTATAEFSAVQNFLAQIGGSLNSLGKSLYPFVNQGRVNVRGGHHDAGDYSKYTINSASLVHFLVFAADAFAGAGALDNLGLPESGDGKSDLLQEAKWEADFLAKLQDADGGFYFLVYPKTRRYENNVLPEHGDPQVVWPKTTAVTAAAVAALAEAGSSPLMKQQFPVEAAMYLAKAKLGWSFLMNAIARHGKAGSYQNITHYGHEFRHDDELAWAAAAMYAATGEEQYQTKLFDYLPDPNAPSTWRWGWWRLFEGYGCAVRTYAFAARTGRLTAGQLNANYRQKCENEIILAGDDHVRFSRLSAYGTSLPDPTKQFRSPGWYFSSERAFDCTVAYQLNPKADYIEAVVANINYEGGSNPLNQPYVTGIGMKRQQEIVSQYAWNDRRILPPAGIPQGNVRQGYGYLETYTRPVTNYVGGTPVVNNVNDLPYLSYPADGASSAPYPFYDRFTDMIDTMCEFVVMDQARSLASLAFWMAEGPHQNQAWKPVTGQISGLNGEIQAGKPSTLTLVAPGIDLSTAQVVWEVRYLQPMMGNPMALTPKFSGDHWIEAEALLPDGRRVVAVSNFVASTSIETPPNPHQSLPLAVTADMLALYHADMEGSDAAGKQAALSLQGNARYDRSNLGWMSQRGGGALRFVDLGDSATVTIPGAAFSGSSTVTLEGMIYINELRAYDRDVATIFSLEESLNATLELYEDKYMGVFLRGGWTYSMSGPALSALLTKKQWHHLSLSIGATGYTFRLNGKVIGTSVSPELTQWGRAQNVTLTLGNFDGWLDEIVVRSAKPNLPVLPVVNLSTQSITYAMPATVPLEVEVTGGGTVQKVEYYSGTTKIGEATSAPYVLNWKPGAVGVYTVIARAKNSAGLTGVSAPITVTVSGTQTATATLRPIGVGVDGKFRLRLSGQSGVSYRIQASGDNRSWTDVGNVALSAGDTSEFVDVGQGQAYKFYRAVAGL